MEDDMEHMTVEEMQRFLILEAEEGKTELEAYRILAYILGIEFPKSCIEGKEEPMEDEGMTEKQFASYLNQLIGRFEDALELEDSEQLKKRVKAIVADMKTDRDTNR